jgi:hypothetical protein
MKNTLIKSNFGFTKWCVALIVAAGMGATQINAQSFTGVYTFTGTTGFTSSFAYNGSAISGVTISPLTQVNLTPNSSTGNMRSVGYPVGATTGSDVFTGSIDTTKYYQFSITADSGKTIDMTSLNFGIGRSATGTRQWQWRSSADNYSAPISVATLATGLTQSSGVITNPDSSSSWTGNVIQFSGASFIGLTSITFRLYSYNSESAAGTAGLQGALTFSGTVNGTATTPAAPVVASASSISTTGFTANWAASSGATKYFLDVATDSGFTSFVTGYQNKDVGNVISSAVTSLNAGTTYYYRVRANNSAGTSADSQIQVVLTTSAAAPAITPSVPSLTGLSYNGAGPSTAQSLTLSVANLTGFPGTVTISGSTNYEVSTTSSSTGFGSSATLSYSDGNTLGSSTVWVRLKAGLAAGSYSGEIIGISGGGTTASFTVSGSVTVPVISVTTTNLGNFVGTNGVGSAAKTNTVTGTNLAGAVTMVATNYFQLSSDAGSTYTNTLVLAPTAGVMSNTVLFRIAPDAPVGNLGTNVVTISSPGAADKTVQVAGVVVYGGVTIAIAGLNTATVAEGAANLTLDVTLSVAAPAGGTTVTLTTTDTDSSELGLSTTTVVFAAGETTKTVVLTPKTDSVFDPSQTIVITATAPDWSVAGTVSVTVTNTDSMPVSYISLTSLNPNSYTQNFDALGTTTIAGAISSTAAVQSSLGAYLGSSTLDGWYATKVSGSSTAPTAITADTGSAIGGLVYNYGAASATDRALGVLAAASNTMAIGALIKNDTGATINSIKVSFTAEFWRSSTTTQNVLTCSVGKVDGTTITVDNFLTASSAIPLVGLNIVGPAPVATNGALSGNVAPNRATFSNVLLPVQLAPGETAFVRWSDANEAGNDAGLAIDDLSMTASLEAASSDGDGTVTIANNTPSSPYALSGIWVAGGANQGVSFNVTPLLDSTTLTSVSILVPTEFGAPVVGNVTTSGGATGGTPAVAGQLVTVTGVSVTKANPAVINIAGLSTPTNATIAAGNGVYPFAISTAGDGGTLKAVFVSPAANVLIPIGNIRDIDANGAPVDKNTIVAVEGVCTTGPLGGTSFIQDASYGIAIYPATTSPAFTLGMVAGRRYAVVGTLVDYNGMAEIKPASVSGVVDLGVDTMPAPISITVAQAKAEQYESMLVTIADLTKDTAETDPWAVSKTITVKNSAGDVIDVRIQAESTAITEPVYPVTITGILQQNSSATPRALTYQIMPRTAGDLSFAPGLRLAFAEAYLFESTNPPQGGTIVSGALTVSRTGADTSAALVVALSASPTGLLQFPASVTIPVGQETATVTVEAIDNSGFNAAGFTNVALTASALGSGLGDGSTTVMILEDEASAPADTIKPMITLIGDNPQLIANGAVYTDLKATVADNLDASREITGTGTVNTTVAGDYTITYNASDAAGNVADPVVRIVRVAAPLGTTYSGWLNGAGASDAAFLDYVFGAVTPGMLDPSLRPTVAVTGGNLVLTYNVRQGTSGLTVTPKTSADLASGPSGWVTTGVIVADVGTARTVKGVSVQQKTASVPVSGAKKFLRVEAVQQ